MTKRKASLAKKLHKWPGLIVGIFLVFFSISGIFLNHRELISHLDVKRKYLPGSYSYKDWNLASVRGACEKNSDSIFLYGNTGIWLTDSAYRNFQSFSEGIPDAAEHRKTYDVLQFQGALFAATNFGLYQKNGTRWHKVTMPLEEHRVVDLEIIESELYVLTRSHLLKWNGQERVPLEILELPYPEDYTDDLSLFKTLWDIHGGAFFGFPGKLFVDVMGVITLLLSVTGILFFMHPRLRKNSIKYKKYVPAGLSKIMLRYHNWLGKYTFVVIALIALTGMFLRPPLLIPIAGVNVPVVPYSHYDQPNPWYDKLRAMLYDKEQETILLSTSEGMYKTGTKLQGEIKRFNHQPVVSVMGINVFRHLAAGDYLVGSFSGLYRWQPDQQYLLNMVTHKQETAKEQTGNPFGGTAVTGFVENPDGYAFLFDYDNGVAGLGHQYRFGKMPEELTEDGTISLWNLALEVHSGRIYSALLGDFYILVVPISGIVTIMVVISGYVIYRRKFKKR